MGVFFLFVFFHVKENEQSNPKNKIPRIVIHILTPSEETVA